MPTKGPLFRGANETCRPAIQIGGLSAYAHVPLNSASTRARAEGGRFTRTPRRRRAGLLSEPGRGFLV